MRHKVTMHSVMSCYTFLVPMLVFNTSLKVKAQSYMGYVEYRTADSINRKEG